VPAATLQLGTSGNLEAIVGSVSNEGVFTSSMPTHPHHDGTTSAGVHELPANATDAGTMTIDNQVFRQQTFNNASAGSATITI